MRKTILMMLLAVVSSSAAAEWVGVVFNERVTVTVYADPATIRRSGDIVQMWDLFDFKAPQVAEGLKYMSRMSQQEYDCKEDRTRVLFLLIYAGNMGSGGLVKKGPTPSIEWEPNPPGSIRKGLWEFACEKR